jgi:hypothetical protein
LSGSPPLFGEWIARAMTRAPMTRRTQICLKWNFACRRHQRCQIDERRLRYVTALWAAFRQA